MNWHRHSILVAKQREIRDLLLRAARRNERDRVGLTAYADDCEETAELIIFLETAMKTANESVKLALDALEASQASESAAKATADAATAALNDAKTNGILNDENTARLAAKFPDAPVETPA